jgi:RNA polymerase subunit RPABC4/transcription elongation factor Spt4
MPRCKRCARQLNGGDKNCPDCGVSKPVEHSWFQVAAIWLAITAILVILQPGLDLTPSRPLTVTLGQLIASR